MDKIITYSTENCFICREIMGAFRNDLTVVTGYSEKTLYQLIEDFTKISFNDEILQEAGICQNCFIKFNEYDQYRVMAEKIQKEIVVIFESTSDALQCEDDMKQEMEITESPVYESYQETTMEELFELDHENDSTNTEMIVYDWPSNVKHENQKYTKIDPSEQKPIRQRFKKPSDENISAIFLDNQKLFQCEICDRTFKEKSKLKSHREIHTTERNVVCPECGKRFKTQACLRSHKRVHNPVFLHCDLCGKSYTQKPEMVKHIKFVHLNIREFFCQICGSGFGSKGHLSTHMLTHSTDQSAKTIRCAICEAAFYTKAKLDRHMKTHTKERNYECSICSKRFLYSYNVTAHVKHVHNGEKRKENDKFCSFCGKKFQKVWALQDHMAQYHQVVEALVEEDVLYEAD